MTKRSTTPAFCYIAPTEYLYEFASRSNKHLVLAHLVDRDVEYGSFYISMSERGDYVMMDNSAYELHEPYSPQKLIQLAALCDADAIVLPDYPFQPAKKTIDAAKEFAPRFKDAGLDTFFVPQSRTGDIEEWIDAYLWAANQDDIDILGMSILGIPNAMPAVDPSYARVVMTSLLQNRKYFATNKYHHYLGLNSGPALEIPSLLRMKALNSIDSSGPVWSGILGHAYTKETDSFQSVSKIKLPVDFNLRLSKDEATIARIHNNINLTNELFNGLAHTKIWYAKD